ncbi:MAG TPA: glycosyltransferase family 2 protein [Longimicrobium sp.]|nr:glycosyltransferase family 2 protein [Longimicrobium sp.]
MVWLAEDASGYVLAEDGPRPSTVPLLSVCIPTYNRAARLAGTLDQFAGVLRRSGHRGSVEMVISDNASPDGTAEVIRAAAGALAESVPLRVYTQRVNVGAEGNFKFLYEHARGDYVLLWGDDDTLNEEDFGRLVDDLARHRPEVCISSFANFGNAGDRTRVSAGRDVEMVDDLRAAVDHVYPLGKISQYVLRRHELAPTEQELSDRSARETSFWFVALAVLLLARRSPRLLLRAGEIGNSGRDSRDMRFSPRVYGTKKAAVLMALGGSPLQAHFAVAIPEARVDNFVVGNLFRTSLGLSRMERDVALDEFRYMRGKLAEITFSSWRNAVKVPFILLLFPVVSRVRYRSERGGG